MKFRVTEKLRHHDAGIFTTGLDSSKRVLIPPNQPAFPIRSICTKECTGQGIPETGITVFASQLHTHHKGIRVVTEHYRPKFGKDKFFKDPVDGYDALAPIVVDNHYSPDFQQIRHLRRKPTILAVSEFGFISIEVFAWEIFKIKI